MNIRFAPELKNQITKIEPNLIHNRFDLLFGDDWEMILIDNNILVPFHIENNSGRVGLYLRDIGGAKVKILKMYKTQWVYHELINRMMGLNSYHAIHANDADYAEAFYLTPIKKYIKEDNK